MVSYIASINILESIIFPPILARKIFNYFIIP